MREKPFLPITPQGNASEKFAKDVIELLSYTEKPSDLSIKIPFEIVKRLETVASERSISQKEILVKTLMVLLPALLLRAEANSPHAEFARSIIDAVSGKWTLSAGDSTPGARNFRIGDIPLQKLSDIAHDEATSVTTLMVVVLDAVLPYL
jgi:hypothetical protein